jgi:2-amino-4-hydroxy-6-hydroxymethyldihydropteridine diphosphokinase
MRQYNYILSLGGNIGNVNANFRMAINNIAEAGHNVVRTSDIYVSEAWGFATSDLFRNMIIEVESRLEPFEMLALVQQIERNLGRKHKTIDGCYESRSIDIDIVFCSEKHIETPRLTIPHPLMHKRNFVLEPMMDHWADYVHPTLGETIAVLREKCDDSNKVWRADESMEMDL